MNLYDLISLLKVQDYAFIATVIGVIITSLIQYFSDRYSPWDWIFSRIGKAINKETMVKLDEIYQRVEQLEKDNIKQDEERKLDKALNARRRIVKFADEIRLHSSYSRSKESYDEILGEISYYIRYCADNPDFQNDKAVLSIDLIHSEYKEVYKHNKFE